VEGDGDGDEDGTGTRFGWGFWRQRGENSNSNNSNNGNLLANDDSGTDLQVDRVDRAGVRRGVLFRIAVATDIVVNVRQRAARPELIPQVNVQVFAAGLRWTGAGTLDGQRGFRYAGSRGTSTHRAARRGHLCKSIIHRHRKCFTRTKSWTILDLSLYSAPAARELSWTADAARELPSAGRGARSRMD